MAAYPSRAKSCAACPPAFASLIPPVRGLLQPTERRPDIAAMLPLSMPGAITSLLSSPSGWHSGGTSLDTIADVRALPPIPAYAPGGTSVALGPPSAPMSILKILSISILLSLFGVEVAL